MRQAALNLSLAAIAGVATLALAEGAVRWLGIAPPGGVATVSSRDFARLPGIFAPNQDVTDRRLAALPFRVRTNSLGFRGAEFPSAKAEGEVRVLMVGDSFTFGDFVEDDETLPAQLESHLICDPLVRVMNAGVGGSSMDTQLPMVERALPLDPDVVVLTFYENDIGDLERPLWDQLLRNREARERFPTAVIYPVVRRLALWNLLLQARARSQTRDRIDAGTVDEPAEAPLQRREQLRQVYEASLRRMASMLRERRIPLVFASYPSHLSLRVGEQGDDAVWAEATARALGLKVVSYWDPLRAANLSIETLYALPNDGHPRPAGYAVAASHLAGALTRDGLLPPCRAARGGRVE